MPKSSSRSVRFGIVLVFSILTLSLIVPTVSAQFRPPGMPFNPPSPPINHPGAFPSMPGNSTQVWTCGGCGKTIGTGFRPEQVAHCPNCGARFTNTVMGRVEGMKERIGADNARFNIPPFGMPEMGRPPGIANVPNGPPGMANVPNGPPGAGFQPPPMMPVNRPNVPVPTNRPVANANTPTPLPVLPAVSADTPAVAPESPRITTGETTPPTSVPEAPPVSTRKSLGRVLMITLGITLVLVLVVGGILVWIRTQGSQRPVRTTRSSRR